MINNHYNDAVKYFQLALQFIADTWREFAPCFLKLYQYEEDQLSVCLDGNKGKHEKSLEITLQVMLKTSLWQADGVFPFPIMEQSNPYQPHHA
ncbi:hypothetical protein V6N13_013042 [Hibiscus sabdariffa]